MALPEAGGATSASTGLRGRDSDKVHDPTSSPGLSSWYRLDQDKGSSLPQSRRRAAAEALPAGGTPESMDGQEMGPEALLEAQQLATKLRSMSRQHPDLNLSSVLQPPGEEAGQPLTSQ